MMMITDSDHLHKSPYPVIVVDKIMVDGVCLTSATTTSEAIVSVVLAHSVLNLNFHKSVAPLMFFVQRYVLGIDDGTKAPQRYLKIVR